MNTSELAIDELFALIRHAAREITHVTPDNTEKNRDIISSHTSRINNLIEALEERDLQEQASTKFAKPTKKYAKPTMEE